MKKRVTALARPIGLMPSVPNCWAGLLVSSAMVTVGRLRVLAAETAQACNPVIAGA